MNTLVEFLKNFLLSPVGTFSTIASVLSIAAWLIVIATRKVTRLELSQKQLDRPTIGRHAGWFPKDG